MAATRPLAGGFRSMRPSSAPSSRNTSRPPYTFAMSCRSSRSNPNVLSLLARDHLAWMKISSDLLKLSRCRSNRRGSAITALAAVLLFVFPFGLLIDPWKKAPLHSLEKFSSTWIQNCRHG